MRRLLIPVLFLICAWSIFVPGCRPARAKAPDLQIVFGAAGLASIVQSGVELLDPTVTSPAVNSVRFPTPDGRFEQIDAPKPTRQTFDKAKKKLTQEYPWGTVVCAYAEKPNRLDMAFTVTNATQKTISDICIEPITLLLPRTDDNLDSRPVLSTGAGTVTVLSWDFAAGLNVGSLPYNQPHDGKQLIPITISLPPTIVRYPIVDNEKYFNSPGRPLLAGKTDTYKISVVFGKPGSSIADLAPDYETALGSIPYALSGRIGNIADLAPDYEAAYTKAKPMELVWPDRRPIGTIFLCNSNTGWKTNPRGYLFGKGEQNDVTTVAGRQAFDEALMKYADTCVKILKSMNAQGVFIWDLEGAEFWHPVTYIGDPPMLPQVSPEMDAVADQFIKKFTDAGLRVGLTIRPTEVYFRPGQTPRFAHRDVKDPVALMADKIAYAKKRWGVTMFYMDSNVFAGVPFIMPTKMIQELNKRFPDCLICPEWSNEDYYQFSAPYSSPNLRQMGTDPETRSRYPTAFRVVAVSPQLVEDYWNAFESAVQGGDVLLFPAWFQADENMLVSLLYRESAIRKQGMPHALKNATQDAVVAQTGSPNEAVRYYAAELLGKEDTPQSQTTLTSMLNDPSPLVRKSALCALAQCKGINDPALIARLVGWLEKPTDQANRVLCGFVADLLGHIGEPAVPALLTMIQANTATSFAYRALGASGTTNPQAIAALMEPLAKPVGADPNEELAIGMLGQLKADAAVPALISVLSDNIRDHEYIRDAAVVALGHIGDKSAIEPLVSHFDRIYSTVVMYVNRRHLDDALREITGQTGLVGKSDWQGWLDQAKPKAQ